MTPETLVDLRVTEAKVDAQIADWDANASAYRRRGWFLLERSSAAIDVMLLGRVPLSGSAAALPVVAAAVRIDYTNFDLWPPSLTFIDPASGESTAPHLRALQASSAGELRDLLIDDHPEFRRPFLCMPGTREYHLHPQHRGDSWLLHRVEASGNLATICDRVWRFMSLTVLGLSVGLQTLPAPISGRFDVRLLQGLPQLAPAEAPPEEGPR